MVAVGRQAGQRGVACSLPALWASSVALLLLALLADLPLSLSLDSPPLPSPAEQIVAYNKMDVPDSSDYWEDIRDQVAAGGVPADDIFAIRCARLAVGRGLVPCLLACNAAASQAPPCKHSMPHPPVAPLPLLLPAAR